MAVHGAAEFAFHITLHVNAAGTYFFLENFWVTDTAFSPFCVRAVGEDNCSDTFNLCFACSLAVQYHLIAGPAKREGGHDNDR